MTIITIMMRYWLFIVGFLALMTLAMLDTHFEIKAKRHRTIVKNRKEYYNPSPDWNLS